MSLTGGSGPGKTNSLFYRINWEPNIDKIYAKDLYEAKYQFLINKRESTSSKCFMILNILLNIQIIWSISIKTLKIIIQI